MNIEPFDKENLEPLKQLIIEKTGFKTSDYSESFIIRRVFSRLLALKINTYSEYIKVLRNDPHEPQKLLKELTIHVTNIFRDYSLWKELINSALIDFYKSKKLSNNKKIRIWSAGCSSGEEAISIAICLLESMPEKNFEIEILATDIDSHIINSAKHFTYSNSQFRELPQSLLIKYFDELPSKGIFGEKLYSPKPIIKSLIKYSVSDIINDSMPKNIDILLCRNTVIYFNTETKSELYSKFYEVINQGGFLILGKTEILQGNSRDLFKIFNNSERIYKK